MHICLVSQEYPPETAHGGIGTQTWNKAQTLTAAGHKVEVLSCSKGGRRGGIRSETKGGITVHRMQPPGETMDQELPIYRQSAYMVGYTWSVFGGLQLLRESHEFDLINFPEYGAEGFAYQLNRTTANFTPVIVQLHGPVAMFAERIGWPDTDSDFNRVATFMEGESIRLADGLMASSANIADFTAGFYGVPRDSIDVVHCGVDCNEFRPPDEESRREECPTVLFVGNITASKGIKTVLEAVLRLRTRYPNIRLQIVGKGDDVQSLVARAHQEGAGANIELLGFVKDRRQLPDYYRAADVVASPAHHEVGVANVYVEAMACGRPVVASTTGGAPEAVLDGETGLLVPPNDVEATAAALDCILGDASLRRRMGEAGRRRAEEYFATEKYVGRVLGAYERTLDRSRERLARSGQELEWMQP